MSESESVNFFQSRNKYDIFEFIGDLWNGEAHAWIMFGLIAGVIGFFAIYKQFTGKDFVKSKKERRRARNRRKFVIWEYKRDD